LLTFYKVQSREALKMHLTYVTLCSAESDSNSELPVFLIARPISATYPLWDQYVIEQSISITIDNGSVFVPEQDPHQNGFRRTEFIAQ